jgi:hypothetical protein
VTPAACLGAQRRAGAKGFGLFTEEALPEGRFIIEYIGEARAPGSLVMLLWGRGGGRACTGFAKVLAGRKQQQDDAAGCSVQRIVWGPEHSQT